MNIGKAKRGITSHSSFSPILFCAEIFFCIALVFAGLSSLQLPVFELLYTFVAGVSLWLFWPLVCSAIFCFMLVPTLKINGTPQQSRSALLIGLGLSAFCVGSLILMVTGFGL